MGGVLFTLLISPHRAEPVSISGSHLRAWLRPHLHSSSPSVATILLGPHALLPPHVLLQGSYGPCLPRVAASASLLVAGGAFLTCACGHLFHCAVSTQFQPSCCYGLTDRASLSICLSPPPTLPQEGLCCGSEDCEGLPVPAPVPPRRAGESHGTRPLRTQ